MPTVYTKVTDVSTSYSKTTDQSTSYTKEADKTTQWPSFGGLIHLATEGLRELLMTEDDTDYIVVSKGSDGISYTKVTDISTIYTKVTDI